MNTFKRSLAALVVGIALIAAPGCALHAKPGTPGNDQRLEQLKKAADVVNRVGAIVKQVQDTEIQLFQAGAIKEADHVAIQKIFVKTADSILVTLKALEAQEGAANPKDALLALASGLDELTRVVGNLSAAQAQTLSLIINAAKILIETAAPLL